jgi:hypothetical protein
MFRCDGREIAGAETLECRRFPGVPAPSIVVGDPKTLKCYYLRAEATDSEITSYFVKRAMLPAGKYVTDSGVVYREYYDAPTVEIKVEPARTPVAPTPVYTSPAQPIRTYAPMPIQYQFAPQYSPSFGSGYGAPYCPPGGT